MQVCAISPMTMSRWMPCFLSCKSKSVLAKPLEHQCSCATISPGAGTNSARNSPPHVPYSKLLCCHEPHCLRDHALAVCRLADRRLTEGFEATSLTTLVQMVDNGLGTTLLPSLAVDAGLLLGTNVVTRPLFADEPARKIGLVWRRGTGRRSEFRLLAKEVAERAKMKSKTAPRR